MKICGIPSCSESASGYSKFCERHKRNQRRHGDPEQSGVTSLELKSYISRVDKRILKNANNETWGLLTQRWQSLLDTASEKRLSYSNGKPTNKTEITAFNEIEKLKDIDPVSIIKTYIAMYLLMSEHPRRFKSDNAFLFQLARRIRGLTDTNAGQYWDNVNKRTKRVYRDISPRILKLLGSYLVETFGAAGLVVARLEADEINKLQEQKANLEEALRSLQ